MEAPQGGKGVWGEESIRAGRWMQVLGWLYPSLFSLGPQSTRWRRSPSGCVFTPQSNLFGTSSDTLGCVSWVTLDVVIVMKAVRCHSSSVSQWVVRVISGRYLLSWWFACVFRPVAECFHSWRFERSHITALSFLFKVALVTSFHRSFQMFLYLLKRKRTPLQINMQIIGTKTKTKKWDHIEPKFLCSRGSGQQNENTVNEMVKGSCGSCTG